jgi:hypothetical protein
MTCTQTVGTAFVSIDGERRVGCSVTQQEQPQERKINVSHKDPNAIIPKPPSDYVTHTTNPEPKKILDRIDLHDKRTFCA